MVQYSGGAVTFSSGNYNITDTLLISANDTLSITTNATVKFAAATYVGVNGVLIINPPSGVLFTAQNIAAGYLGMRIDGSNATVLRKLTFEYAVSLRILDCSPLIDSCVFQYNNNSTSTNFGISTIVLSRSKSVIKNSQFLNNQRGAISGGFNIANAPQIINNIFRGNNTQNANVPQINMSASGSDTMRILNNQLLRSSTNSGGIGFLATNNLYVIITGNVIKNNRYGITFNGGANVNALVSYNQVDSNNTQNDPNLGGSGISFSGGSATSHQNVIVTGNLLRWNLWGITIVSTSTGGGAKPNLGNITNTDTADDGKNQFVGNTNANTPNIHLYNNNVDSIFAQNNYWDVAEGQSVESSIFHQPDNAALGFVNYLPLYNPLPVKLAAFSGIVHQDDVVLNWKTLTETNSHYFEIERSTNGRTFTGIEKIAASGNTSVTHSYHFTDKNALQQFNLIYYRLKLVDKDGKFIYSPVISIRKDDSNHNDFVQLYPTVINSSQLLQATITSSKIQKLTICFYSAEGRLLSQTFRNLIAGKNVLALITDASLPNGIVYVQFTGEDFMESIKLVKQ